MRPTTNNLRNRSTLSQNQGNNCQRPTSRGAADQLRESTRPSSRPTAFGGVGSGRPSRLVGGPSRMSSLPNGLGRPSEFPRQTSGGVLKSSFDEISSNDHYKKS
jgi:hypothetical protein